MIGSGNKGIGLSSFQGPPIRQSRGVRNGMTRQQFHDSMLRRDLVACIAIPASRPAAPRSVGCRKRGFSHNLETVACTRHQAGERRVGSGAGAGAVAVYPGWAFTERGRCANVGGALKILEVRPLVQERHDDFGIIVIVITITENTKRGFKRGNVVQETDDLRYHVHRDGARSMGINHEPKTNDWSASKCVVRS